MSAKHFIAVDLGATSGRTILGTVTADRISIEEINRFPNGPVQSGKYLTWDFDALFGNILAGLKAVGERKIKVESIGIETWGVDVAFFGKDGSLLSRPLSYRNPAFSDARKEFCENVMSSSDLYARTGIQVMDFNTIFQFYHYHSTGYAPMKEAANVMFLPDAISYMLTGSKSTEYTIASTSALLNPHTRTFDEDLLKAVGVSPDFFPQMIQPGTKAGSLKKEIADITGLEEIPVIAVAEHDTASAVAAVPSPDANFAYLSSGTWSLMGVELPEPVISRRTAELNITNEGGVNGTIRFLKNITGMWILEQCLKKWKEEGFSASYPELVAMAEAVHEPEHLFNPDDESFASSQDMPAAIDSYFADRGWKRPETKGEYVRCIFESMAGRYGEVMKMLQEETSVKIERLHIIGGGSRNAFLNNLTEKKTGVKVVAGPAEATAIGNVMMQAKAAGLVSSLSEMRSLKITI